MRRGDVVTRVAAPDSQRAALRGTQGTSTSDRSRRLRKRTSSSGRAAAWNDAALIRGADAVGAAAVHTKASVIGTLERDVALVVRARRLSGAPPRFYVPDGASRRGHRSGESHARSSWPGSVQPFPSSRGVRRTRRVPGGGEYTHCRCNAAPAAAAPRRKSWRIPPFWYNVLQ